MRVQQFVAEHASRWRVSTQQWYSDMLKPLAEIPPSELTTIRVVELYRVASKTKKPSTCAAMLIAWKAYLRWLGKDEVANQLKLPRVQLEAKFLTPEQCLTLIALAKKKARNHALILFMLDTGCRASEIVNLTVECMSLENQTATVTGKGDKARTVAFSEQTKQALVDYLNARQGGYVFLSESTKDRLTRTGLHKIIARLAKKAGFRVYPHLLRHTSATLQALNGMDIAHIQQLLGHTNVQMTQRYAQAALQMAALEAHKKFSPVTKLLG